MNEYNDMTLDNAIEKAILDRGVEPPADLNDIVFVAAEAARAALAGEETT